MTASYFGEMPWHPDHGGFTGGTCVLKLDGCNFELSAWRGYIYSIDEHDTLRGTYRVEGDSLILEAREHYSYTWETEKRETTKKVKRTLVARVAGPDAVEISADLTDSRPLLLRRKD
jgi:hypothetical protein